MKMRAGIWAAALVILACVAAAVFDPRTHDGSKISAIRELEAIGARISYPYKPESLFDDTWFKSVRDPVSADLNDVDVGDRELALLRCIPTLESVNIRSGHYRPESLAVLGELKNLQMLSLCDPGVTDESVKYIPPLGGFALLCLEHSSVTDAGLKTIGKFTWLKSLLLDGTAVTDAGLDYLSGMTKLKELTLDDTEVSDAGLAKLQRLPSVATISVCRTRVTRQTAAQFRGLTRDVALYWRPRPQP
jgi:hypothetical protein